LMDLCPAATHVAAGHAARFTEAEIDEVERIVAAVRAAERALFAVPHRGQASRLKAWQSEQSADRGERNGELEYVVWSEIWTCPGCRRGVDFGEAAYDPEAGKVASTVSCQRCNRRMSKRNSTRIVEEFDDPLLRAKARRPRWTPLFTAYRFDGQRY